MENESVSIKFNIDFHQPIDSFCLVVGGWHPLVFTPPSVVLVDRNVTGILKQIGTTTERSDHEANEWWFSFLNSDSYTLNPILCAYEGNRKQTPSLQEFKEELDFNINLLANKLPLSKSVSFEKNQYEQLYETVQNLLSRRKKETDFLIEVAPLIKERLSDKNLEKVELKIFKSLKENKVSSFSLIVIAVLSCLYEDKNGKIPSIGRKLIKPTTNYNEKNAYNTLSDIGHIEIFIGMQTFFPDSVSFITRDRALAAFWCALKISDFTYNVVGGQIKYNISLNNQLFCRLSECEIDKLKLRLVENNL